MKPLYWTRLIVTPVRPKQQEIEQKEKLMKLLWEEIEEARINDEEFINLFSRQVVEKKTPKKKIEKAPKIQVAKLLDSKRSQSVGILASSLHLDFSDIENAIYNLDTSVVSLEVLQQIYDIRATEEELTAIKNHVATNKDQPLDKPEQFLIELSKIPHFVERIACFVFQAEFGDSVLALHNKLSNVKITCDNMVISQPLKKVFSIILACGNFMNGGNIMRGQADGFGLDILAKLKDVKSKDNSLTLLHFIVKTYLKSCEDALSTTLPVPEPHDVDQASSVHFDDIRNQLNNLTQNVNDCKKKVLIITSDANPDGYTTTFKDKIDTFLSSATKMCDEEKEYLDECQQKFNAVLKFYQFQPKGLAPGEQPNPKDFFPLWVPFCTDFKILWRSEQEKLLKEKLKEARRKEDERRKQIKKGRISCTGLKSLMKNLSNDLDDEY